MESSEPLEFRLTQNEIDEIESFMNEHQAEPALR